MLKVLDRTELPLESTLSAPNLASDLRQKASRAEKRAAIDLALLADPDRSDADIAREVGCDPKTVRSRRSISRKGISNSIDGNFDGGISPPDEPAPKQRMPISAANADDPNPRVMAGQQEIEIYLNDAGDLVLKQANWPDEDSFIIVAAPYKGIFLDKVCDVLGVM